MNDFCGRLDRIQLLFQRVVQEVFTSQCTREQTELHSLCIEQTGHSKVFFYFDKEQIDDNELKCEESSGTRGMVQKYLKKRFGSRKTILKNTQISGMDGQRYEIIWICLSECLDNDCGSLVLRCLFEQLVKTFNEHAEIRSEGNKGENNNWLLALEREVIEETESRVGFLLEGMFRPFDINLVNGLSGEYYEKTECVSNMVFLPYKVVSRLAEGDLIYHFNDIEFASSNIRLLRKMLQITQKDLWLVLGKKNDEDVFQVSGICTASSLEKIIKDENRISVPCISVKIKRHLQWDMFLDGKYILTCKNGHYKIEQPLKEQYLKEKITGYFGEREDGYQELIKNILFSQYQEHGAMLVVMEPECAQYEAQRLGALKYGFMEEKPRISEEINCLNAIDGSVIVDIEGRVYGIGMILDGLTQEEGNLARGARYNSAVKFCSYLRHQKKAGKPKAMILIVSEDGTTDIIFV